MDLLKTKEIFTSSILFSILSCAQQIVFLTVEQILASLGCYYLSLTITEEIGMLAYNYGGQRRLILFNYI